MGFLKRGKKKDEVIAELRQSINKMNLRSRKFEKDAIKMRAKAKQYAKTNRGLAKQYLMRYNKAQASQKKYDAFILKLEDRILALEAAEDTNEVAKAMISARDMMKKSINVISREKAIEIEMESKQMMDEIDQAGEVFADVEDLELDDEEFESQLDELEAEELLGEEVLPDIPDEPVKVKEKSKVKKDLEELKRELNIDD
ncbi:MAG: Snf7 family protein [Candidatus Helarchaeota archaeon]